MSDKSADRAKFLLWLHNGGVETLLPRFDGDCVRDIADEEEHEILSLVRQFLAAKADVLAAATIKDERAKLRKRETAIQKQADQAIAAVQSDALEDVERKDRRLRDAQKACDILDEAVAHITRRQRDPDSDELLGEWNHMKNAIVLARDAVRRAAT